jgi:arylsulfatase
MGVYGYSRPTSPKLDEYARQGVVFDRAYAQAASTFPSTAAVFTGRYPSDTQMANERMFELSQECKTLAEVLKDAGYRTGFFSANPLHAYDCFGTLDRWSPGFEQGFDEYFVGSEFYSNRLRAAALNERAIQWIGQPQRRGPFLACIWYIDVHTPYEPPPEFRELFPDPYEDEVDGNEEMRELWKTGKPISEEGRQHLINLYDAEIAYTDSSIGDMLDTLADKGVLANTLVMVTADHGEAFHEHGQWVHGFGLYEELIHIPLLIIPPQAQTRSKLSRNDSLVGLIDLMPTMLDYAAVPSEKRPDEIQGVNLRQLVEGTVTSIERHAIAAELGLPLKPGVEPTAALSSRAIITERFKLIETWMPEEPATVLLFDLEQDPLEQHSLADDPDSSDQVEFLRAQLKLILGEEDKLAIPDLPEHVRDRLRAIGYL